VLLLFLVVLTVIFVIGVIVVDVGLWLSERRQAQSAADMAALAAATELRNSDSATRAKGRDYARRNGFDDGASHVTVSVTPRFDGDPDEVEVVIEEISPPLFGQIFKLADMDIGARAVARIQDTPAALTYAMFAGYSSCSGSARLEIEADDTDVEGAVHTNSRIHIDSDDNRFDGPLTYTCSGGFDNDGSGNSFNPSPQRVASRPVPLTYTFGDFACTRTFTGNVELDRVATPWVNNNLASKTLKDNVICATGNILLDSSDTRGRVTLVANGKVDFRAHDINLTPLWNNVLAFAAANGGDAIEIDGDEGRYTGFIFAPNGRVDIEGEETRINGSLVAERIRIIGRETRIDATGVGQAPSPPNIWLVE
jgi:hypothetical protein